MSDQETADREQPAVDDDQPNREPLSIGGETKEEQGHPAPPASGPAMTQGVRATRVDGGRRTLERAAKVAARTGRRADVHEYMRVRRGYM